MTPTKRMKADSVAANAAFVYSYTHTLFLVIGAQLALYRQNHVCRASYEYTYSISMYLYGYTKSKKA